MYAVIFRAKVKNQDEAYFQIANEMRLLAEEKYGCREFVSVCERGEEIAISYWDSHDAILQWKNDVRHKQAQEKGKKLWYSDYKVEVVKIERRYGS